MTYFDFVHQLVSALIVAAAMAVVCGRPQNAEPVKILKYENDVKEDGSYAFK